jgi:copper resistance protein C
MRRGLPPNIRRGIAISAEGDGDMVGRAGAALAIFLVAGNAAAFAHALLRAAEPAPNSTVAAAPATVAIDFTEAVEPRFSTIAVLDAAGRHVDNGRARTASGDARRLIETLWPLKPGTYRVVWHAVSVDTHRTEGSFRFIVAP